MAIEPQLMPTFPAQLCCQSEGEQTTWLMANLHEQCELLEIVLLYHKDYCHPLPALLKAATCFQVGNLQGFIQGGCSPHYNVS